MSIYTITPNDVLFFRDARPFETGSGHGARWPEPSILFSALHAALHRAFPEASACEWEHRHRHAETSGQYDNTRRDKRFGSLQTVGPFPQRENEWFFPAPGDAASDPDAAAPGCAPLRDPGGSSDLPQPLRYPLANTSPPKKSQISRPWWSKAAFEAYLRQQAPGNMTDGSRLSHADLYGNEWMTGIGIDPETRAQDGTNIYSAEYLRLNPGIAMGLIAAMPLKKNGGDGLKHLFAGDDIIIVGGQQRLCRVRKTADTGVENHLPVGPAIKGERVKWVLLSPAVFPAIRSDRGRKTGGGDDIIPHPGGWLPNWIDPAEGRVLLKRGDTARHPAERRDIWRQRVRSLPAIDCRLVAARIPRPVVINGWSERLHLYPDGKNAEGKACHGATATHLAVPAGAVYYFEGADAADLAATLNWHGATESGIDPHAIRRRSTLFGEQGFGIGVCASWSYSPMSADVRKQAKT